MKTILVLVMLASSGAQAGLNLTYTKPLIVIKGSVSKAQKLNSNNRATSEYSNPKQIYVGCGHFKTCVTPSVSDDRDCLYDMSCSIVYAVGKQPITPFDQDLPDPQETSEIVLEVYATSSAWIAFALSTDHEIGEDLVFECIQPQLVGRRHVGVSYSWNWKNMGQTAEQHKNSPLKKDQITRAARIVRTSFDGNGMYCMFYIKDKFQARPDENVYSYDLRENQYCIYTAFGDSINRQTGGVSSHKTIREQNSGYGMCASQTKLTERFMPDRREVKVLQSHGSILCITYVTFTSVSVFVARYYKQTFTKVKSKLPVWLWFHAILGTVAALCAIIGGICGTVGASPWQSMNPSPAHKYVGGSSITVLVLSIPTGVYIQNTERYKHAAFYIIHNVTGHLALIAGILILILTSSVETAFADCLAYYFAIGFLIVYVAIHIIMSANRLWVNKCVGDNTPRDYTLTPMLFITQRGPMRSTWDNEPPKSSYIRLVILIIYILTCAGVSAIIVFLIWYSDNSCSQNYSEWTKLQRKQNNG